MIDLADKTKCCGCFACVLRCPQKCITITEDIEGFLYPHVNVNECIDCGICENTCPCINIKENTIKHQAFAAKNPSDKIRQNSSSGGVFTQLAETIISKNGIVCGVKWDQDWNTIHSYTINKEELHYFRRAKYIQTKPSDIFISIEKFLKEGKYVLFSGLPCQIQSLKLFLSKDYPNLYTVSCVCHGVPSEKLWKKFLSEQCCIEKKGINDIVDINLRDKRTGWKNYSCTISFNDGKEISVPHDNNPWMRALIFNLTLRPSCYHCPSKIQQTTSDITLGDFWGSNKVLPNEDTLDKGLSLVILHSKKGEKLCEQSGISFIKKVDIPEVSKYNSALINNASPHPKRDLFYAKLHQGAPFIYMVNKMTKEPFLLQLKMRLAIIKKTINPKS